ncbi:testis-expressed protein 52 [Bombina bombina]|uniref:testis-expressed protein 52 n=1 Tax=Bombina bombina TaxID=8345 RepID=UPI00235B0726|nr:testis-expressed protein 52 [Bombina bombina]
MLCSTATESLLPDAPAHSNGFSPRGCHRVYLKGPPYTDAKLEMLRKLRNPPDIALDPHHNLNYLTWLEVSRLPPLLPLRPDRPYDSTVWRHLTEAPQRLSNQGPIPPPSQMAENTLGRYIMCSGRKLDKQETQKLHLLTQGRVPPKDLHGNILPPKGFKRYRGQYQRTVTYSVPSETCELPPPQNQHKPHKMTLQEKSPRFANILQRYQELQETRTIVPYNSRMSSPRHVNQTKTE